MTPFVFYVPVSSGLFMVKTDMRSAVIGCAECGAVVGATGQQATAERLFHSVSWILAGGCRVSHLADPSHLDVR